MVDESNQPGGPEPSEIPVRYKHVVPAQPGYFAVYYDVARRVVARQLPVIAWAAYERVEFHGDERRVCDVVEALVLAGGAGHGEAELAGDCQNDDGQSRTGLRLLGITFPGDASDRA